MQIIKCRFCNLKLGTIDDASVIADARCDTHSAQYGDYKTMEQEFFKETGKGHEDFKKCIADSEYKKDKFSKEKDKYKAK
jgi:hypothetical protein